MRYRAEAIELEPNYPVYCVYIPTEMKNDYEVDMMKRLKIWGESMGENVFVADWAIGHPNYRDLRDILRPRSLFILSVDDPDLMTKNDQYANLSSNS